MGIYNAFDRRAMDEIADAARAESANVPAAQIADGVSEAAPRVIAADAKDRLIAWALRYLFQHHGIPYDNGGVGLPSAVEEYLSAARRLVPDVEALAEKVGYHADLAITDKDAIGPAAGSA